MVRDELRQEIEGNPRPQRSSGSVRRVELKWKGNPR